MHLHIAQAFVPEVVLAAHRHTKIPYVAHMHLDVGPSGSAGFLLKAYQPMVMGPVLRSAAAVIVFNEEQRSGIAKKYRVDPARIVIIPNGVDAPFFEPHEPEMHKPTRLLFVGRLAPQKNVGLFLRALEGISGQFETTLVGDGESGEQMRALASELSLENVSFHGSAHGAELLDLYRNADIFVLPSEREGMPLVLLEAMAVGLPVIATDVIGNRDVVENNVSGILVDAHNPASLRTALLELADDPARRTRLRDAAKSFVASFSWPHVTTRFDDLYASILGAPERGLR